MEQANPPVIDPSILSDNLAALRRMNPALAERLAEMTGASDDAPEPARARDGQTTFRLRNAAGRSIWFARTSVPAVRGEAVLARFDAGVGNVLLPGVGQGYEVSRLLERLGQHRAVFVWEPDTQAIPLALSLHRWADAIDRQRLIVLACGRDALAETLVEVLAERPGHLCPERILMWPGSAPAELAECRSAVQQAYTETQLRRERQMTALHAELASQSAEGRGSTDGPSAWGVFSLDPRCEYVALGEAMADAIRQDGQPAVAVGVRGPADVHPLARLQRVADGLDGRLPEAAIVLNTTRQELHGMFADDTPTVSWMGPACRVDKSVATCVRPTDRVLATSSRIRERLCAAGLPQERVAVLPWPCLVEPSDDDPPSQEGDPRPVDVALVADLAATEANAYGCTLWTHARIWKAACAQIRARVDRFDEEDAEQALVRAQRETGARIEDAASRSALGDALGTTVANAFVCASLVEAMRRTGIRPAIYGKGWPVDGQVAVSHWPTSLAAQFALLRRAKTLVYADVTGTVTHVPLLAAAAGAVVVTRSNRRDRRSGGLATLLEPGREMAAFSERRALISVLGRLLRSPAERARIAAAARHRCLEAHSPSARWRALREIAVPQS